MYAWQITPTGSDEEFRGLAAVDRRTAWVSGESGSVLKTTDRGATWHDVSPPQAAGMALRDIEAFGPHRAVALAISAGDASRIFATRDGGSTWREVFRNPDPVAFYDCMAFSHDGLGLAMSDPVDGHFQLARTTDWGLPHTAGAVVAVGPTGSDVSTDAGRTWTAFDDGRYDGIQCAYDGACWASGTEGRVARLVR